MIRQRAVTYKTAGATLTYSEMGDVVVNSASANEQVLPTPASGLWYVISNVGAGIVTISYNSSTITTLSQYEQARLLANSTSGWWMSKGGGSLSQATETTLGGIKAKAKTGETNEVAIDSSTGKLYTNKGGGGVGDPIFFKGGFTAKTGSNFVCAFTASLTASNGITVDNSLAKLTIKTAGRYAFYYHQLASASGSVYFNIRKNSAVMAYAYSTATYKEFVQSIIIDCAVDDVIDFTYSGTVTAAWANPHSSVYAHKIDGGAGSLLASYTVAGSAVTSIDFTGLDITTHKSYRIEAELSNATADAAEISLFINNDTTTTDYYSQWASDIDTTQAAARVNKPEFAELPASSGVSSVGYVKKTGGYASYQGNNLQSTGSGVKSTRAAISKTATVTNITQLTFTSSVASSIAVGSTIRIYRGDM